MLHVAERVGCQPYQRQPKLVGKGARGVELLGVVGGERGVVAQVGDADGGDMQLGELADDAVQAERCAAGTQCPEHG